MILGGASLISEWRARMTPFPAHLARAMVREYLSFHPYWCAGMLAVRGRVQREGEVAALVAAGWEPDTQGYSHSDLVRLNVSELRFEIDVTRRRLQRIYHVPVNWFCYPSGYYDPTVIAAVRAAGYIGATTVIPGWARRTDDQFTLPRLRVLSGTSPQALLALITSSENDPIPPPSYGN